MAEPRPTPLSSDEIEVVRDGLARAAWNAQLHADLARNLLATVDVERAARERAEADLAEMARENLAETEALVAARERAEQQLAATAQHLPLLRGAIADYELLGPARLDHTMRSLVRRVRALLDASTTEPGVPCEVTVPPIPGLTNPFPCPGRVIDSVCSHQRYHPATDTPCPTVAVCGDRNPYLRHAGEDCELPPGHEGRHQNGLVDWPDTPCPACGGTRKVRQLGPHGATGYVACPDCTPEGP